MVIWLSLLFLSWEEIWTQLINSRTFLEYRLGFELELRLVSPVGGYTVLFHLCPAAGYLA